LDDLLKTDSSRIYVSATENGVILEVRDKGRDSNFGPAYSFDDKGNLKLYAFLVSKDKYGYMEEYDSTGNLIKKEGIPIVQKMIFKKNADSIQFTYFFFSLNKKYENIEIFTNEKDTIHTEMFKNNHYTNMKSASFTLPVNSKNIQRLVIYSKGDVINLCNHSKEHFNDTTSLKNINL
jgi:hypothetical protein